MTQNQLIALYSTARKSKDYVFIEGFHALKHAIRFDAEIVSYITDAAEDLLDLANTHAPDISHRMQNIEVVDEDTFGKLTPRIPRTRVVAIAKRPPKEIPIHGNIVLLDNPKDLGNVGTIIRTCAAAGISSVLVTGDIDPWHPTVVLSATGLQFAITVANIGYGEIPKVPIVAFDERGEGLDLLVKEENQIYAFGSERVGLSEEVKTNAAAMYRIPMKDGISSLNLSASVAVIAYR